MYSNEKNYEWIEKGAKKTRKDYIGHTFVPHHRPAGESDSGGTIKRTFENTKKGLNATWSAKREQKENINSLEQELFELVI
jgi:hypothetical protein